MSWTPSRVVLISRGRHDEAVASADCYPGMLLQRGSNGQVAPHAVQGGGGELMVAEEDAWVGGDITQKLASGYVIPFRRPAKGDVLAMLLKNGQNVANAVPLMSAGDGTLMVSPAPQSNQILYQILAASTNITNVTAETTFSNGTYTIPASFLLAGDVLHIHGRAVVSAQNSTNTHDVKVYIGSTALADCGASALAAGNFAEFDIVMTIRSIGASGKFIADVVTTVNPAGVTAETPAVIASTTIDTTVTEAITVKSTASAQSTGNVIALQEFEIDLQRAGGIGALFTSDEAIDNSGGAGSSPMSGFSSAAIIRVVVN